jgi:hypothetical protein
MATQIILKNIPKIPSLFSESSIVVIPRATTDSTIGRSRYVNINLDLLDESELGDEISLNLFDNVRYTAILENKTPNLTYGHTLIGILRGVENSRVILIVSGNQLAGNLALHGSFYQISYISEGVHAISKIDPSAFPQDAEPVEP